MTTKPIEERGANCFASERATQFSKGPSPGDGTTGGERGTGQHRVADRLGAIGGAEKGAASFTPPFEIYHSGTDIADVIGHVLTAENPEIAKALLTILNSHDDMLAALRIDEITFTRGFTLKAAKMIDSDLGLDGEAEGAYGLCKFGEWVVEKRRAAIAKATSPSPVSPAHSQTKKEG